MKLAQDEHRGNEQGLGKDKRSLKVSSREPMKDAKTKISNEQIANKFLEKTFWTFFIIDFFPKHFGQCQSYLQDF